MTAAIPILLLLAFGVMLLVIASKPSTSAVDPIGGLRAILGLALGLAIAIALFSLVWFCASNGALRLSVAIIVAAVAFDFAAVPLSRWIASRVTPLGLLDEVPNKTRNVENAGAR
jgi:hypothetical protein